MTLQEELQTIADKFLDYKLTDTIKASLTKQLMDCLEKHIPDSNLTVNVTEGSDGEYIISFEDALADTDEELICDDCKQVTGDVKKTICPYDKDVHSKNTEVQLCSSCYHERSQDI